MFFEGSPLKGLSSTLLGNSPCRGALLSGLSITLQECPHYRDVPFVSVPTELQGWQVVKSDTVAETFV